MKVTKRITENDLFTKISPLEIYEFYMPFKFTLNRRTKNPFVTKDNNPSFVIGDKYGTITHFAFNSDNKGDCISFVSQLYNISRHNAVDKIYNDLKIGNRTGNIIIKESVEKEFNKQYSTIQVIYKPFTEEELKYWEDYYQGLDDLKRENIYSISKAFINKERMRVYEDNMSFGYYYPEIDRWKLYCPSNPIVNGISFKWRNNVIFDYLENLDKLQKDKIAFISKSKKDAMVLEKALNTQCIIRTQSENPSIFKKQVVEQIKENSKQQVTVFDNDSTGVKNSWKLTELYGFQHCNVPYNYLKKGLNDFADLAKTYGINKVTNHFKNKQLI